MVFPLTENTDILLLFAAGVGISLPDGSNLFPLLFDRGRAERSGIGHQPACGNPDFMGLVSLINLYFGPEPAVWQVITSALILLLCSAAAFAVSYPLAVVIFREKEY